MGQKKAFLKPGIMTAVITLTDFNLSSFWSLTTLMCHFEDSHCGMKQVQAILEQTHDMKTPNSDFKKDSLKVS